MELLKLFWQMCSFCYPITDSIGIGIAEMYLYIVSLGNGPLHLSVLF